MQERPRRTWLILTLLSYSVAAALAIGLTSLQSRGTVPAHTAGMQLQGSADGDENSAAPDDGKSDGTTLCQLRDCPASKQEHALVFRHHDAAQRQESKSSVAQGDEIRPKSKD